LQKFDIKKLHIFRLRTVRRIMAGTWKATRKTSIVLRGFAALYGGPAAAVLPEHSHAEAQVTVRFASRASTDKRAPVGVDLWAPRQPHSGGWKERWEVVVFHLSPERLAEAAEELVPSGRFEILPKIAQRDRLFEEMARTVVSLCTPTGVCIDVPALSPCVNVQVEPAQPSKEFLANATMCHACDGGYANRFVADQPSCTRFVVPFF
jgi:hypothetical protein